MKCLYPVAIAIALFCQRSGADVPSNWGDALLRQSPEWYGSQEAQVVADNLMLYQSEFGAWPKNTNLLEPATEEALLAAERGGKANTIDNGATTKPMRFLALVYCATSEAKYRDSFERGVRYLLESQYPNGGFPQFYPLRGDNYYSRITFNDDAMVNVLEMLGEVEKGEFPYEFVSFELRERVADSVSRGVDCILKSQIRQDGRLTAWCAQIDEHTLAPAWARAYEPPSLSGGETVGIVKYLMSIEDPSSEIIAAVDGAVEWLRSVPIKGKRLEAVKREDGRRERVLVDDDAAPLLWARFYELETNRPLYLDRDSVFRYRFEDIGYERRSGYSYHGRWAASLLEGGYIKWRQSLMAWPTAATH